MSELMSDRSIRNTYAALGQEQTPFFRQIRDHVEQTGSLPTGAFKAEADGEGEGKEQAVAGGDGVEDSDAGTADVEEQAAEAAARDREVKRRRLLMQQVRARLLAPSAKLQTLTCPEQENRELVARVLENTVFNLMREAAAGDTKLTGIINVIRAKEAEAVAAPVPVESKEQKV